ncbi:MAG: leucine-rich repeat domain-containing protein [Thermoflexibacter sp.]
MRSFIFISLLLFTSAFHQLKDAKSYYESGMKHLKSKQFLPAIADFTHAISINVRFKEAYLQRAKAKLFLREETELISMKDIYSDLLKAKELGEKEAFYFLWKKASTECYTRKAQLTGKEEVYCLDYSRANLKRFPSQISYLTSLLSLHLNHNQISRIGYFPALENLITIDVDNNRLSYLPANIHQLSALVELNASFNQLKALPHTIAQLKNLKALYLRGNKIEHLPISISQLQSLEILDVSLNSLKKVPQGIENLKNLQVLYLFGNEIPEAEIERLKAKMPYTVIY